MADADSRDDEPADDHGAEPQHELPTLNYSQPSPRFHDDDDGEIARSAGCALGLFGLPALVWAVWQGRALHRVIERDGGVVLGAILLGMLAVWTAVRVIQGRLHGSQVFRGLARGATFAMLIGGALCCLMIGLCFTQ
jgi:hypothetical protein